MNAFEKIMKRQNKTAIEVMNIAAHELAVENMRTEDYETWEQGEKLRDAEIAELQADNARLRLVESAAKKLLGTNPTRRWVVDEHNVLTLDEMNALDEALKGETK